MNIIKMLIELGKFVAPLILGFVSGVAFGLIYDWIITRRRNKKQ